MSQQQARILVADDQRDVLSAMRMLLKGEGFAAETVNSPAGVLQALKKSEFDAVIIDLNYTRDTTSGEEGLELLEQISAQDSDLPVIIMTAWGSIELAVEAMRRGARDFVEKPWDNSRLLSILKNQVALSRAIRRGHRLEAENKLLRGNSDHGIIADSPAMRPIMQTLRKVAPAEANILLTGENGTGKSMLAKMVHSMSNRSEKPLITVNMGGLAETVFESEMFGHVKGAFTDARSDRVGRFEMADAGTLFLDEIANIPAPQQAKLLRVLEDGEFERLGSSRTRQVDVRIISATNADIPTLIESGDFRQDLLFRLNTVEIRLPPLRERPEDIPKLADRFLANSRKRYRSEVKGLDAAALKAMASYDWPGNVRELQHCVERAVLMAAGDHITEMDLGLSHSRGGKPELDNMTLEDAERQMVESALERHRGNVNRAAKDLGLSRSALYRRLEKFGLEREA